MAIEETTIPDPALPDFDRELRDFVENVPVPVQCAAPDGTILWTNPAELEMLGFSAREYVGANIADFHVSRAAVREMTSRLCRGEALRNFESILRRKDGEFVHVSIDANPKFHDGHLVWSSSMTRDITRQKRAVPLQERLAAIVESSDDAIISKDLNGMIQSWNRGAQRIFGYTAQEAIGHHISMLAAPERADEIPQILERISRGESIDHFQTRRRTKDGRILNISLTVSPVRDALGNVIGASKVARDVTEQVASQEALRATNESLRRSNADLEHFAYSASHDLQEPLRMVASYAEMLELKFGGQLGEAGAEYIRYIVEGASRMEQLLTDLRAYTRVSKQTPEPVEDADANAALGRAMANLEKIIAESGAVIVRDPLPKVRVHDFQLQQLFQNLLSNAIRYRSEAPPEIRVGAEKCSDRFKFSVQDNGIGIEPEYKEHIFGIFKRLHSSAEYPGTGMGLAICQRIIDRTGGQIWVESEPGRGATFFFTLPAGKDR